MVDKVDCVVVGAGVVGLASMARALALRGREVLVLETAPTFGTGTATRATARSSTPGCTTRPARSRRGCACRAQVVVRLLRRARHSPPALRQAGGRHGRCPARCPARCTGACPGQWRGAAMAGIATQRVPGAQPLECVAALHSPDTGIVDSHALMLALLAMY